MMRLPFSLSMIALMMIGGGARKCDGQDLIEAPADAMFYELSNLRSERGITGDTIAFDYQRTREGTGNPVLAVRTDQGPVNISGFGIRIGQSGTIRLQDQFARIRSTLNRGQGKIGFQFYFTTAPDLYSRGNRFLISNPVVHGTVSTQLQARPPSQEEIAMKELERKSKLPPETVPDGYVRSDSSTVFVPGAPVMVGRAGRWQPARVVSILNSASVEVVLDELQRIVPARRQDWLAVSESTMKQMRDNPEQFSINLRTLPDGKLVLDDDAEALQTALPSGTEKLVKGTPLLLEHYSGWKKAYFLSTSGIDAGVVMADARRAREERVPLRSLAIRNQTLSDLDNETTARAFADNVADYRPIAEEKSTRPQKGMMSSTDSASTAANESENAAEWPGAMSDDETPVPVLRTWKDQTGKFSISATMDRKTDEHVFLKRADGKVVQVPIAKLSEADQSYLQRPSGPLDFRKPLKRVFGLSDMPQRVASVAISPDNRFLLIGRSGASASLIELQSGRVLIDTERMSHLGDVDVCGFTPDGKHILLGGDRGVVETYLIDEQGKITLRHQFAGHSRGLTSLAISPDSQFVLTGGADKVARYWEIETGQEIKTLSDFDGKIKATFISPSGKRLMATDGKTLQILDLDEGETVQAFQVGKSHASGQSAAFAPNGLLLAVNDTYAFRLWNLETRTELAELEGRETGWSAIFAPDSRHLITGGNGVISLWDAKTQSRVQSFPVTESFYIQTLGVNSDGSLIVCPAGHRSIEIYQASR